MAVCPISYTERVWENGEDLKFSTLINMQSMLRFLEWNSCLNFPSCTEGWKDR